MPRLRPEIHWPTGLFALACVPMAVVGLRGRGQQVLCGALGGLLAAQLAVALAFPALARFRPIPAFAERIRAAQDESSPEPAVLYRVAIHSLNFYLGRATSVARTADELRSAMGERGVAFVVVPAHRFDAVVRTAGEDVSVGLKHELRGARFEEMDRLPLLSFHFGRAVLGRGGSPTRDLLLLRVALGDE